MKTATDYADAYNSAKNNTVAHICISFLSETLQLLHQTKSVSASEIKAVLHQQNAKWKDFAERTNGDIDAENGFKILIQAKMPEFSPFF